MTTQKQVWHLPVLSYGVIDAYNRMCAAVGSPTLAMKSAHADYNGHSIDIRFNTHRQYYTADYWWAGRNCIARGTLREVVEAAVHDYKRGALGSSVEVVVKPGDDTSVLVENGFIRGELPREPEFLTWRHKVAARCAPDYANSGRMALIFDSGLLEAASCEPSYREALKAKYGHAWR